MALGTVLTPTGINAAGPKVDFRNGASVVIHRPVKNRKHRRVDWHVTEMTTGRLVTKVETNANARQREDVRRLFMAYCERFGIPHPSWHPTRGAESDFIAAALKKRGDMIRFVEAWEELNYPGGEYADMTMADAIAAQAAKIRKENV